MTQEKTISSLAMELYKAFESRARNNGETFNCLKDGSPKWMTEVIYAAHGEALPDDTIYSTIEDCAATLAELDNEATEEEAQDAIMEMEPSVYTHDLTKWLDARVDHIYYLTQALEECAPKDGFQALAIARKYQIDEIGNALVSELSKLAE